MLTVQTYKHDHVVTSIQRPRLTNHLGSQATETVISPGSEPSSARKASTAWTLPSQPASQPAGRTEAKLPPTLWILTPTM